MGIIVMSTLLTSPISAEGLVDPVLLEYAAIVSCVLGVGLFAGVAVYHTVRTYRRPAAGLMVICVTIAGGGTISMVPVAITIGGLLATAIVVVVPVLVTLSIVNQLMTVPIRDDSY